MMLGPNAEAVGEETVLAFDLMGLAQLATALGYDQRAVLLLSSYIQSGLFLARDGPIDDDDLIDDDLIEE
ncbi:hypothetical protein CCP2SC5_1790005 [Azospirillaceae bacterium]